MPTPPVPPRVRRPINRRQARADGISDWQLRHKEVVRTFRDTYLPQTASKQLRQRISAVLRGAPDTAVVSHFTAAALWGCEVPLVPDDGLVHLTVPATTRARNRADRKIHSADLPERAVLHRGGIRTGRRVVVAADGRAGSPMESVLRWLILEAGLPARDLQHVITQDGRFVGKVDLAGPFCCVARTGWSSLGGRCCASPRPTSSDGRSG